ncbi:MAG: alpha/beta fold hydrolase [Phycisphaerales bacterium]|nr:alpha/beta fold hydrolase [Phycisphaerales bacterium]
MSRASTPDQQSSKRDLVLDYPKRVLIGFLLLLIASNIVDMILDADRLYWGNLYADQRDALTVEIETDGLSINVNPLEYRVFMDGDPESPLPPVVLIHGSPGAAIGFEKLSPMLSLDGRRVISYDLPGFASQAEPITRGSVFEDYSSDSYGAITWRMLDAMGIDTPVHLVGWSNGGAVALRMIEDDPDRVASLTLLAAVGAQETEGTGSYAFEHFKYKAGRVLLDYGSHFYPHFGLLGPASERGAFLRFFDDTDQRDLGALMRTLTTPTMILHGRDDFLIADRSAIIHHEMIPTSRLVMLDAMHFIPMLQAEDAAGFLNPFFARHDQPGVDPKLGIIDLAPLPEREGFDRLLHALGDWVRSLPILVQVLMVLVLVRVYPTLGSVIVMVFVAMMDIDFGVAAMGIIIGYVWWLIRGANVLNRPWTVLRWVRSVLFILPLFMLGGILGWQTKDFSEYFGIFGFLAGVLGSWCLLTALRLGVTWEGRQRILGWLRRAIYHEYWPRVLIYLPVLWWGVKRMVRRGLQPLTAVNPGYAYDGGVQDESKFDLNIKLGDGSIPEPSVLHCVLIDEVSALARLHSAQSAIQQDDELGGYPIIAKPNKGERGRAVKLIKTEEDLESYCQRTNEPFVLQRFHAGPDEVGVLWMRHTESITDPDYDGPTGFIYAITIKHFPILRGDGTRTLRRLILAHPRHRAQPAVFFEHNRSRLGWIPLEGEKVKLGIAGNHAQGAKFTDGSDFITPALTDRMNEIIDGFDQRAGRGFDIGRFDLRCESLDQLAKGTGFGIVELNGLTSEPTNLYDPKRSLFWAWDMLLGYWKHLERLAEARIATKTGEPVDDRTWDKIRNALIRAMI